MEGYPPIREIPNEPVVKRYKFAWRAILIFNFALGAYMFAQAGWKERVKEKTESKAEVVSTPTETTAPPVEEPAFEPPVTRPVIVRQPIPEDRQRELFEWMLEEKRKIKPTNRQEKKQMDEEKAILKQFIRSKSVPSI
ncbi:uncharacterized protein LOC111366361 [Olea europaea var. sylvestris]|uniref:uncharacterized protein LOC111366361 n=1 Tax=Olea europaea var. sylvestris TaxID=158386 RepID=UPI000C1D44F7|nr:uncharacterized protein LOC111366361 [Olea europaea var. sylvestris]